MKDTPLEHVRRYLLTAGPHPVPVRAAQNRGALSRGVLLYCIFLFEIYNDAVAECVPQSRMQDADTVDAII